MPDCNHETLVTFAGGSVYEKARVTKILAYQDKTAVLTNLSPFHPVDYLWPDQPADQGSLVFSQSKQALSEVLVAAANEAEPQRYFLHKEIPVRRDEAGWCYFVAHMLPKNSLIPEVGEEVELFVDEGLRNAYSQTHTVIHLMSLALNKVLASYWRKGSLREDSLGNPNFDKMAIVSSFMGDNQAIDTYRLGKSLRKKGFDPVALIANLQQVAQTVADTVNDWIACQPKVTMTPKRSFLRQKRLWSCYLPEGLVQAPCGGTHCLPSLNARVEIALDYFNEEKQLCLRTYVKN